MLKIVYRFCPVFAVMILVGAVGSCGDGTQARVPSVPDSAEGIQVPDTTEVELLGDPAVVGLLPGAAPTLDPDRVAVNRGDLIRWRNPFEVTVTIHLERAPVTPTVVEILPGEVGVVAVLTEAPIGSYKYDVTLVVGGETIIVDPYIDVEEEGGGGRT